MPRRGGRHRARRRAGGVKHHGIKHHGIKHHGIKHHGIHHHHHVGIKHHHFGGGFGRRNKRRAFVGGAPFGAAVFLRMGHSVKHVVEPPMIAQGTLVIVEDPQLVQEEASFIEMPNGPDQAVWNFHIPVHEGETGVIYSEVKRKLEEFARGMIPEQTGVIEFNWEIDSIAYGGAVVNLDDIAHVGEHQIISRFQPLGNPPPRQKGDNRQTNIVQGTVVVREDATGPFFSMPNGVDQPRWNYHAPFNIDIILTYADMKHQLEAYAHQELAIQCANIVSPEEHIDFEWEVQKIVFQAEDVEWQQLILIGEHQVHFRQTIIRTRMGSKGCCTIL